MTLLSFYGYSDDVVYAVNEDTGSYKDAGAYGRPAVGEIVAPNGEKVRVVGIYAADNNAGCWAFGLQQCEADPDSDEEGLPIPTWAQKVEFDRNDDPDYSVRMYIDVPEGSTFKWLGEEE